MMRIAIALLLGLPLAAVPAHADPANCQKQIVNNLLKFKKTYLKKAGKCVDNQNIGKIAGPCPDAATQLKVDAVKAKIRTKIETSCPAPDLATLGFPASCDFGAAPTGVEGACAALPVGTPGEFADCLLCWKGAELSKFLGTLYASHAVEVCGGALDATSPVCSAFGCTTPLPVQQNLGDTAENDCQKAIGKGGIKHLVSIEKVYEKCGLLGNDEATCDADLAVQAAVDKSKVKLEALVKNKCGNRDPIPDPPFCCRTGTGNACSAAVDRNDCEVNLGGTVQAGKTCDAGSCSPVGGGNQKITWWSTCPRLATCDGTLDTLTGLIECVDETAGKATQQLLCVQFPTGWSCPSSPSGAFLD